RGVLAGQLDFARKGEVVADEHRRADDQARREGLVMTVSHPHDEAEVAIGVRASDLEEAKVSGAVAGQAVRLADDRQPGTLQAALDAVEKPGVRDRNPTAGSGRRGNESDLLAGGGACVGVQGESSLSHACLLRGFLAGDIPYGS